MGAVKANDSAALAQLLARELGTACHLTRLGVKCTYPVFRGDLANGETVFVKLGTAEEWQRTRELLAEVGESGFFAQLVVTHPLVFDGASVFVMSWREGRTIRPEDFTEAEAQGFVRGCAELSFVLSKARAYVPLKDSPLAPEKLYAALRDYAARHPLVSRMLRSLIELPSAERTYGDRHLAIVHGDFHAKNFAFVGDRLAAVYDFDKLTESLACGDFVNALMERFSSLSLSRAARKRLVASSRRLVALAPWPREELIIAANSIRLAFAARRILKHPASAWVAFDIARRDRKLREFVEICYNI